MSARRLGRLLGSVLMLGALAGGAAVTQGADDTNTFDWGSSPFDWGKYPNQLGPTGATFGADSVATVSRVI